MKIINANTINPFGGINFIFEYLEQLNIGKLLNSDLPVLPKQSHYSWKDLFFSLSSIYYCGGEYLEDLNTIIKAKIDDNPYCNIASPDTVSKRMKELDEGEQMCKTERGSATHFYSTNEKLTELNIKLLKKLGVFNEQELTIDYDNTIIFNEKKDSKMTYKRDYGYQPGVCTINVSHVLYIENRNGNSDARSFQDETLSRMFEAVEKQVSKKIANYRGDSASYLFKVIKLVEEKCENFYIAAKNVSVQKYFNTVENWEETVDTKGEKIWIGEVKYTPFIQQAKEQGEEPKEYRLIIKKKQKKDPQLDLFTQDNYQYTAIITNDYEKTPKEIAEFYYKRGRMENIFDILKNDFGWNNMPFSNLSSNHVFLYLTAMVKNLYNKVVVYFSDKTKGFIASSVRMKRFIFKLILIPAKWLVRSRQKILKVYGRLSLQFDK